MRERPEDGLRDFNRLVVQKVRRLLDQQEFASRHKRRPQDFTRRRHFCFMKATVFLLQKTVRSLQLHLHEFFHQLDRRLEPVSASAWSQARLKLRHTAFIELNEQAILEPVYAPDSAFAPGLWRGHRLLAIDSSLLHLPATAEAGREFGWVECQNQKGQCGRFVQGRLSVLTDVENRLALQALLVRGQTPERALAVEHLSALREGDVVLLDRNYTGYELWARLSVARSYFVCRCGRHTFAAASRLFVQDQAGQSVWETLGPPNGLMTALRVAGLPLELAVRWITVRLDTGELEVLATNLPTEYEPEGFGQLYARRWGIETYYHLLKSRLELENFTGSSLEAVRQDLHAAIFLSNFESILSAPRQRELARAEVRQQPNRAVSFHTLKWHLLDLLISQQPIDEVLGRMERWLQGAPVSVRPGRKTPRPPPSARRSYWFQRHRKKSVY
jgi:hypothetical protein